MEAEKEITLSFPPSLPLRGDRVSLLPMTDQALEAVATAFADPELLYFYLPDLLLPRTRVQLKTMMEEWNDGRRNFVFSLDRSGETIGLLSLSDLDLAMGHAEAGIMIAQPVNRGQGFATEGMRLLLDYAFGELGLHRVYARVAQENTSSLQLFRRLGFVEEGRMREAMRRGGRFLDLILFGLLAHEYDCLRKERGLAKT